MSKLEGRFWRQLVIEGLTDGCVREFRFHPTRKWRFDMAWPDERVACEVQGGIWVKGRHARPQGMINDYEKFSEAAALGWRLVYVTGLEVTNGAGVDRVRRTLLWGKNSEGS